MTKRSVWGLIIAITVIAGGLRMATIQRLDIDGHRVMLDFDPYYHIRRADLLVHGISIPPIDYFSAYPFGAQAHWEPIYDVILMAFIRMGQGFDWDSETATGFVPVILGLLSLFSIAPFFRRRDPPGQFLIAMALLAILPAHLRPCAYGFPDHHVLELLLATITLAVMSRVDRLSAAILTGLLLAFCQLAWRGAILIVGIAGLSLLILSFIPIPGISNRRWSGHGAAIMITASIIYLLGIPLRLVAGNEWSFYRLSVFQSIPFMLIGLILITRNRWLTRDIRSASLAMGSLIVGLLIASIRSISVWREGISFLLGHHPWRETITESFSIFRAVVFPPWNAPEELFTALIYLIPLMITWHLLRIRSWHHPGREVIILTWVSIMTIVAIKQHRYAFHLAVPFILLVIITGSDAFHTFKDRLKPVTRIAIGSFVAFAFLPVMTFHYYLITEGLNTWHRISEDHFRAIHWLRDHTPECGDFYQPEIKPDYGIMNSWETGHWITWLGRRPPVANNFGAEPGGHREGLEASCRFFTTIDGREAGAIMDALQARFVLTENFGEKLAGFAYIIGALDQWKQSGYAAPASMRLHIANGSDTVTNSQETVEGVDGFRLIYESDTIDRFPNGTECARVKIFERVTGARIDIPDSASPPYRLSCHVQTNTGRSFDYTRIWNQPLPEVSIPYSTTDCPYPCRVTGPVVLEWRNGRREYTVSETAVQTGDAATD